LICEGGVQVAGKRRFVCDIVRKREECDVDECPRKEKEALFAEEAWDGGGDQGVVGQAKAQT